MGLTETLLQRVEKEAPGYNSGWHAAIDHLNMAHSHLFEETQGRDFEGILSDIDAVVEKINNIKNR